MYYRCSSDVLLIKSRHGRNMIAIREEELASQAIGINVFRYKMTSLAISAFYAGVGGAMLAHYLGYLQPLMFQLTKSTEYTIMVIFGGLGSVGGSVIGALVLTALPEIFRAFSAWRGDYPYHDYPSERPDGRHGIYRYLQMV